MGAFICYRRGSSLLALWLNRELAKTIDFDAGRLATGFPPLRLVKRILRHDPAVFYARRNIISAAIARHFARRRLIAVGRTVLWLVLSFNDAAPSAPSIQWHSVSCFQAWPPARDARGRWKLTGDFCRNRRIETPT